MVDRQLIPIHELSEQEARAWTARSSCFAPDWQRAPPEPRLSWYLPPSDEPAYSRLLVELIKEDMECRRQPGRAPKTPSQYVEECQSLQGIEGIAGELFAAADAPSTRAWSGLSGPADGAGLLPVAKPARATPTHRSPPRPL